MSDVARFDRVLICDDIRREDNGKFMLIGIYGGDIVINSTPATLLLNLWLLGEVKGKEVSMQLMAEFVGSKKEYSRTYEQQLDRVYHYCPE